LRYLPEVSILGTIQKDHDHWDEVGTSPSPDSCHTGNPETIFVRMKQVEIIGTITIQKGAD